MELQHKESCEDEDIRKDDTFAHEYKKGRKDRRKGMKRK